MDLQAAAELIAKHALAILVGITVLLVGLTAVLWRLIESRAPALITRLPRYLGIHALVSFTVALASIGCFFEIADEIGIDEDLALFDQALSDALSRHLGPGTLAAFGWLTHLGDAFVLIGIGAAVVLLLLARSERLLAAAFVVITAGGACLNRLLKALFARTRPVHDHGYAIADGWSFPSGHSSGSLLVYGLIGYLVVRHTPRVWHIPAATSCMLLLVLVGSSRVLLQVHYFSDVLAGWAVAAAWLSLSVAGLEAVRRSRSSAVASTR
ncbi:MAG: phosphatase PAP2 family protein [Burkholderiaceae bacterium]